MDSDNVSTSSITAETRHDFATVNPTSSWFSGNTITLVHILSEVTAFAAMAMWVRNRTNSLQKQVNDLKDVVSQQTTILNEHTTVLQSMMAGHHQPSFPPSPVHVTGDMMKFPEDDAGEENEPEPASPAKEETASPAPVSRVAHVSQDSQDSPPARPRVEVLSPKGENNSPVPMSPPARPRVEVLSPIEEVVSSGTKSPIDIEADIEAELADLK